MRINQIATHRNPHLDEYVGIYLLQRYGRQKYPGIENAKVVYYDAGRNSPDGTSAEEWEARGVLAVGIWGGKFDEHANGDQARKLNECAATLIAKDLGIADRPELGRLLAFTKARDLGEETMLDGEKVEAGTFDLASLVKQMHLAYPDHPETVRSWVDAIIRGYIKNQEGFFQLKEHYDRNKLVVQIPGPSNRVYTVVLIRSNNKQVLGYARSKYGDKADIVVQQQTSGHIQILPNQSSGSSMRDTVHMVRIREMEAKELFGDLPWKDLSREGVLEHSEEWYYQPNGGMLLNGSLTARNMPPTKLGLHDILEILMVSLNPRVFDAQRQRWCQEGECSSTQRDPCPLYKVGLGRCHTVRTQQRRAREAAASTS
ncbi:MAG: hypothetical protein A3D26_02645 [Candidatus Blackburnbacteria bacterium RIFCSPHIGHO2_02_FULL_44_20]|uniref:Uncharacterized protein n=1 Tax=Candidatus Blackburnbacteria bacterium RIFCSPHIGHO2_02_FULL_44_20 TaxID=1797516 RepID=A0A1G1V7S8_9BACT|nr:MAG: hypothetical protein A3E16_03450 [Candidatus Blackburnbacteria bacterium RIFCSPHIGHO2_12_FULL_44_25]OGY11377.1 MAG: hypothetical protein A3D26_02645 [Candidatus Blackburnbacteria bacterium RIFCSPHIGHO2_02_FULL_44_20]